MISCRNGAAGKLQMKAGRCRVTGTDGRLRPVTGLGSVWRRPNQAGAYHVTANDSARHVCDITRDKPLPPEPIFPQSGRPKPTSKSTTNPRFIASIRPIFHRICTVAIAYHPIIYLVYGRVISIRLSSLRARAILGPSNTHSSLAYNHGSPRGYSLTITCRQHIFFFPTQSQR